MGYSPILTDIAAESTRSTDETFAFHAAEFLAQLGARKAPTCFDITDGRECKRGTDVSGVKHLMLEDGWPFRLVLTADGRRQYAREVVPRLGLMPPATILAPTKSEPVPFDDLGLEPELADNLRYRWEEAARCTAARAWLAATALYASILEVVLPDWLSRDIERARAAGSAPEDKQKRILPLDVWSLASLIKVAVELGYIDGSLGRHAQALRESRNLIHPERQIRERSAPDADLTAISKRVVRAVLDALARATHAQAATLGREAKR